METTMNNLFQQVLNKSIAEHNAKESEKERKLKEFLDDMKVIKKNLDDAFRGTCVRVEMGMFGQQDPKYTTIRVLTPYGNFSGIMSNKAVWRCMGWQGEDKDFRRDGAPMTYERLFEVVARHIANEGK